MLLYFRWGIWKKKRCIGFLSFLISRFNPLHFVSFPEMYPHGTIPMKTGQGDLSHHAASIKKDAYLNLAGKWDNEIIFPVTG
jgi:hypothetical protein